MGPPDSLIEQLKTENIELRAENDALKQEIRELKARLGMVEEKLDNIVKPPPKFVKPNVSFKKGKPGGRKGHKGRSRLKPKVIDEEVNVTLTSCPHCQNALGEPLDSHPHLVEDIPLPKMVVTKYNVQRYWCGHCKRKVSSKAPGVKSKTPFGNNLNVLVSLMRSLGMTVGKIRDIVHIQYELKLSNATILRMEQTVADSFKDDYESIKEQTRKARVKNGDETSWRVNGQLYWLWTFVSDQATLFSVEKGRGSANLVNALGGNPEGILVSDFYSAYSPINVLKQKCLIHLLREFREVRVRVKNPTREFVLFQRRVKRLINDAVKVWSSETNGVRRRAARTRFENRVKSNYRRKYTDPDCQRISKTMFRHIEELFLFVEHVDVEWHNNQAERALRPIVVMRKNSFGSRSDQGAKNRAVIMSILQTLKKQGLDYIQFGQQRLAGC